MQAALGALDVDIGLARQRLQAHIVERTTHHRNRRTQFVRQTLRQVFQMRVVMREPLQHGGKGARQIADLVHRALAGNDALNAALRINGAFGFIAQAAQAPA